MPGAPQCTAGEEHLRRVARQLNEMHTYIDKKLTTFEDTIGDSGNQLLSH